MRTRDAILSGGAIAVFAPPIRRAIGEVTAGRFDRVFRDRFD